jgi:RES domain-containing protein
VITSWRIARAEYADSAFNGEGAARFGSRWNPAGIPVVYTAQSASLAALELLVHLDNEHALRSFVLFACTFRDEAVDDIESYRAAGTSQQIGAAWVAAAREPVLRVPSVVIETEFNYLLNPVHPDFAKIEIADPVPFRLDMRLLRR